MLFIELHEKQPNGKEWTKLDEDTLSAKFSALMRTGLIHCQLFNIGADYSLKYILFVHLLTHLFLQAMVMATAC